MLEEKREYDEQNRLKARWYEDENGIRQGKHLIYYENGNIHRNKSYINNNPTGHNTEYDLNGNITSLDFFINNQKIKCDLTLSDIQYKNNHIFEVVAFSKEGILLSQYHNFIEEEKNNGTIHSVYKYKNAKDYSSGIGEFWHYSENDLTFGKIKNHKMFEEISFIDYKKQIEEKYWISEDGKKINIQEEYVHIQDLINHFQYQFMRELIYS